VSLAGTYQISTGGTTNASIVDSISSDGADAVLYAGYETEGAPFADELRESLPIPLVGSDGLFTDSFITATGAFNTDFFVAAMREPDNIIAQAVLADHEATYGEEAGPFFLNGYAAAMCLFEAIEATGSNSSRKIGEWLMSNSVDTPLGSTTFDENGEAIGEDAGFTMYEIAGGEFVEVDG
jgi:branched-chain amino acid transport system substrate-binding protein